jgi:hypothetical protein
VFETRKKNHEQSKVIGYFVTKLARVHFLFSDNYFKIFENLHYKMDEEEIIKKLTKEIQISETGNTIILIAKEQYY